MSAVVHGLHRYLMGGDLAECRTRASRDPTEEEARTIRGRNDSFDPATFDYSALPLTDLMRGRLVALLARRKGQTQTEPCTT